MQGYRAPRSDSRGVCRTGVACTPTGPNHRWIGVPLSRCARWIAGAAVATRAGVGSASRPQSATLPAMDYLWTPWRYAYVTNAEKAPGCIFCDLPRLGDDV